MIVVIRSFSVSSPDLSAVCITQPTIFVVISSGYTDRPVAIPINLLSSVSFARGPPRNAGLVYCVKSNFRSVTGEVT